MELGTFGAIIGFAMELEQQAATFGEAPAPPGMEAAFRSMAEGCRKRLKRLERARREGVVEMILESITGLHSESYQVDLTPRADAAEHIRQALAIVSAIGRFYRDAAAKVPIKEIVRLFGRFAAETARCEDELSRLPGPDAS